MCAFLCTPLSIASKRPRHGHTFPFIYTSARTTPATCNQNRIQNNRTALTIATTLSALAFVLPVPAINPRVRAVSGITAGALSVCIVTAKQRRKRKKEKEKDRNSVIGDLLLDDDDDDDDDDGDTHASSIPDNNIVFSGSRAEWGRDNHDDISFTATDTTSSVSTSTTTTTSPTSTSTSATSGVYSYRSETTSRKVKNRENNYTAAENKSQSAQYEKKDKSTHPTTAETSTTATSDTSSTFSHMRAEFTNESHPQPERTPSDMDLEWSGSKEENPTEIEVRPRRRVRRESKKSVTVPLSSGQLARRMMGLPVTLVRDVLAPTADVVLVAWYDIRVTAQDWADGKHGMIVPVEELDDHELLEDEEWILRQQRFDDFDDVGFDVEDRGLTEEEEQVLQVERVAGNAVKSVRNVMLKLIRRF